jgi:hypothetical protein
MSLFWIEQCCGFIRPSIRFLLALASRDTANQVIIGLMDGRYIGTRELFSRILDLFHLNLLLCICKIVWQHAKCTIAKK